MSKKAVRAQKNGTDVAVCDTISMEEGAGIAITAVHDSAANKVKYTITNTGGGGGGPTPTGTGFRHVTAGVEDAAAKQVEDADVDPAAAIAESKLALNFATHSNANDPSAGEKAALAGTSGAPGAGNKYVTDADTRLDDVTPGGASGLMSGTDKTKLDGIAAGAEVNVNADWNAGSGDAQILNKPATFAPTAHKDAHKSGGGDAFVSSDLLEAIVKRLQESGGTTLLMGAVADGEYLKRSGTGIIGATPSAGSGAMSASARSEFVEDCIGIAPSGIGGVIGWTVNVSGGQIQPSGNVLASATHPGIWEWAVTSVGNYATLHAQDSVPPGAGTTIELEILLNIPTLSDGTHRFLLNLGFGDQFNTSAWQDGVYIEYDDSASANWRLVAVSGGVSTVSDSGVAVATGWTKLKIAIDGATSAQLYVNGAAAGAAIGTNIPNSAGACGLYFRNRKTVGSALRIVAIDYIHFRSTFTSAR